MYTSSKVNDDAWKGLTFSLRELLHKNFVNRATADEIKEKQLVSLIFLLLFYLFFMFRCFNLIFEN